MARPKSEKTVTVYGEASLEWIWRNGAIRVNDLWISPRSFAGHMGRHSDSLIQVSEDTNFQVNLLGSVSILRFGGNFFAIASQHQVDSKSIDRIALSVDGKAIFVTANRYFFRTAEGVSELREEHDLCAFEFTDSVADGSIEKGRFFDLTSESIVSNGDRIVCGGIYGFAFEDHNVEIDSSEPAETKLTAINRINREVICKYCGEAFDGE